MAMSKLQGPAQQYMSSYYVKVRENKDLGTWQSFLAELAQIYRQRDNKEGAKKELTPLNMIGRHHMFVGVSSAPAIGVPAVGRGRGRRGQNTNQERAHPAGSARVAR